MIGQHLDFYLITLTNGLPSGILVFLVALPLCLGVALSTGALIAVTWSVGYDYFALRSAMDWHFAEKLLAELPISQSPAEFIQLFFVPDFSYLTHPQIDIVAAALGIFASLYILLGLGTVDKLDPLKRVAPTNRELAAQRLSNIISGLIGGLSVTAVIVRSAANVNAGGKSKVSSFIHGYFLLISVMFFARFLNQIPLACLAAILLQTGYKLASLRFFWNFCIKAKINGCLSSLPSAPSC